LAAGFRWRSASWRRVAAFQREALGWEERTREEDEKG
jgi:hypothetical protein